HGRCAVSAFRGVRKCRSPQIPLAKNRTRPESRSPPKETPPQKKSLPQKKSRSPLAGEGRGGGCHTLDARSSLSPTPTPTRPRRGGGGRKKWGRKRRAGREGRGRRRGREVGSGGEA